MNVCICVCVFSIHFVSFKPGSAKPGSAKPGSAKPGSAKPGRMAECHPEQAIGCLFVWELCSI